jgi:hypothetical protein
MVGAFNNERTILQPLCVCKRLFYDPLNQDPFNQAPNFLHQGLLLTPTKQASKRKVEIPHMNTFSACQVKKT